MPSPTRPSSRSHSSLSRSVTTLDFVNERIAEHDRHIAALEAAVASLSTSPSAGGSSSNTIGRGSRVSVQQRQQELMKQRVLSTEQRDAMMSRLTRPRRKYDEELPPIPGFKKPAIDADGLTEVVSRLGEQDVDLRRQKEAEAAQREAEALPLARIQAEREMTTKLELAQQDAMGRRLCDEFMARKTQSVQRLRQQLMESALGQAKTFEPGTIAAVTERVYGNSVQRRQQVRDEMTAKYVAPTEVHSRKLDKEQMKRMADRLSQQHGAS